MANKALQEFTEYADVIEAMKPLRFLESVLAELEAEMDTLSEEENEQVQRFCLALENTFQDYNKKGVAKPILGYALYNTTMHLFKEVMLERKAMELGLHKPLFKQQMTFLFKGKRR